MRATTTSYIGTPLRIKLLAAVIALAGSGVMVGANLGIAEYYAANADVAQSRMASDVTAARRFANRGCTSSPS